MSTDFEVDVDSKWIRQGEGIVKLPFEWIVKLPFVDFNINVLNSVYQHGQMYNKYLVTLMGFFNVPTHVSMLLHWTYLNL